MYVRYCGLLLCLQICVINASLLLWSSKQIYIPALKKFTQDDFKELMVKLGSPKLFTFKGGFPEKLIQNQNRQLLKYTAYVPNADVVFKNVTELSFDPGQNNEDINRILSRKDNQLVIFLTEKDRDKRDITEEITENPAPEEVATGPVVYNTTDAIIYSSKPLLLKINSTNILLGKAYSVTADTKAKKPFSHKIIKANFHLSGGKLLFVSFIFPYSDTYWSLTSTKIEFVNSGNKYNLTTKRDITAPKRFSYHCSGQTVFTDPVNGVELYLYDMQVQLNITSNRFDDAYDCVPFTTGPIWSGLFVTSILAIGLVVALTAIGNIKTMDKFDNHRTKQLAITVFD